uniref:Adipocyte plasma membrane-associated protein n=1 Tax=Angiostrongylus cantonensis TaxID=6313 RepID=A0A0K0CZX2_ANGCA
MVNIYARNVNASQNGIFINNKISNSLKVLMGRFLPLNLFRLAGNVESVIIGSGVLKYVTGCVVLPNGTVLATDEESGLLLFDIQGNLLKTVTIRFTKNRATLLTFKNLGPKWMRKETIVNDRLSIAHTDYIYLSVCGGMFSALYELTPVGQWTELQYRISESYLDMLAFAVVGPITQILVVEGKLGYALQFSVRESEVVDRRRLAICERPGPIARDEAGRLFIVNRASTSIQLVDTVRWAPARNVALTDSLVPHFSASWGLLAVALKGAIRLQRYSFRLGYN